MTDARRLTGFIAILAFAFVVLGSTGAARAQEAAPAPAPADAAAAAAPAAPTAEPPAPAEPAFSQEQLDQMLAPIALYPDPLLMQMLMSSTYPLEIVEAERWVSKNKSVTGTALDKALEAEDWDPSVKSMTHFPDVLSRMSENLDWTQDLGDAFLGQQTQVLDTVQTLRKQAYDAGNLQSGAQQTVNVEQGSQVIKIEPAQPEVVYVPQYNSAAVYGAPPPTTQYYPQANTYTGTDMAMASVLSFGVGLAVGGLIWGGDCDWDDHDVYYGGGGYGGHNDVNINVDGDVNIGNRTNIGSGNRQQWQHNPAHREGVRYRDAGTQQKFANATNRPGLSRESARGYNGGTLGSGSGARAPGVGQRPAAPAPKMPSKGLGGGTKAPSGIGSKAPSGVGNKGPSALGGKGPAVANKAAPTQRPSSSIGSAGGNRPTAVGGLGGGSATRAASARGASSRGGSFGGGGGMRGGGGGGMRGGGGGRGGRR